MRPQDPILHSTSFGSSDERPLIVAARAAGNRLALVDQHVRRGKHVSFVTGEPAGSTGDSEETGGAQERQQAGVERLGVGAAYQGGPARSVSEIRPRPSS
jgi:hypothetical protein